MNAELWATRMLERVSSPIVLAAWEGGLDDLRLLLEFGADPNFKFSNGVSPLATALRHGNDDRVELLKLCGAT